MRMLTEAGDRRQEVAKDPSRQVKFFLPGP